MALYDVDANSFEENTHLLLAAACLKQALINSARTDQ